jgi:hypothetical protein
VRIVSLASDHGVGPVEGWVVVVVWGEDEATWSMAAGDTEAARLECREESHDDSGSGGTTDFCGWEGPFVEEVRGGMAPGEARCAGRVGGDGVLCAIVGGYGVRGEVMGEKRPKVRRLGGRRGAERKAGDVGELGIRCQSC